MEPEQCHKPTRYHLIAGASQYACVLPVGHEGECQPGGTCVKHGPYVGLTNGQVSCPQWPNCIDAPAAEPAAKGENDGTLESPTDRPVGDGAGRSGTQPDTATPSVATEVQPVCTCQPHVLCPVHPMGISDAEWLAAEKVAREFGYGEGWVKEIIAKVTQPLRDEIQRLQKSVEALTWAVNEREKLQRGVEAERDAALGEVSELSGIRAANYIVLQRCEKVESEIQRLTAERDRLLQRINDGVKTELRCQERAEKAEAERDALLRQFTSAMNTIQAGYDLFDETDGGSVRAWRKRAQEHLVPWRAALSEKGKS